MVSVLDLSGFDKPGCRFPLGAIFHQDQKTITPTPKTTVEGCTKRHLILKLILSL